jgi:hypothetical protein
VALSGKGTLGGDERRDMPIILLLLGFLAMMLPGIWMKIGKIPCTLGCRLGVMIAAVMMLPIWFGMIVGEYVAADFMGFVRETKEKKSSERRVKDLFTK